MSKEQELKEAMERNKLIRDKQQEELEVVLKNDTNDKSMKKISKLEKKVVTRTSKDDRRANKAKIFFALSSIIALIVIIAAVLYFVK